jgi:hypothetical protein
MEVMMKGEKHKKNKTAGQSEAELRTKVKHGTPQKL